MSSEPQILPGSITAPDSQLHIASLQPVPPVNSATPSVRKRRRRRPRRRHHKGEDRSFASVPKSSTVEVLSSPLPAPSPLSSVALPLLSLPLPLRTSQACRTTTSTETKSHGNQADIDDDDLLELIPSSQGSNISASLEQFKSHPPTRFTKITSAQLISQLAVVKSHNRFLQTELQRSRLENVRLQTTNQVLVEHRTFVETTLRNCQDTYLHEADSAKIVGIHAKAGQYDVVVDALQDLRNDIDYENFQKYHMSHGRPPPSRYWIEGPRRIQQQYDNFRS